MKMPEMDGSSFYRTVRKNKPALSNRIIFSTGDAFTEKTQVFIDSVANPHIEKPFNLKELKEVIALVL